MAHAWVRTFFGVMALAFAMAAQGADNKGNQGKVSGHDRHFINEAAEGGHAEVELGKLAQQNGATQAVKEFGQRMIADHGTANQELEAIATKLGVTPPKQPGGKHHADAKKLMKLKGADFDREYAAHMVKDHERTVALFEKQAKSGESEELKAFAAKQLPILQEHLKMARGLSPPRK